MEQKALFLGKGPQERRVSDLIGMFLSSCWAFMGRIWMYIVFQFVCKELIVLELSYLLP